MRIRGRITWIKKPQDKSFEFLGFFFFQKNVWNFHEIKRDILSCCHPLAIFCLSILLLIFNPTLTFSESNKKNDIISQVSTKVKLGFGYDSNVSERAQKPVTSRFYQFYVNSGMYMLPTRHTVLSIKLQDGLKHLDAPSLSGESIIINSISLNASHKIEKYLEPEINGSLRSRTSLHSETDVLPSEEAYLKGHLGTGIKIILLPDIKARILYNHSFINFEDFDPFDRSGYQTGIKTDIRILPGATLGVQYLKGKTISANGIRLSQKCLLLATILLMILDYLLNFTGSFYLIYHILIKMYHLI